MTPPVNPYVNVYRQPGYKHRVNDDGRSNELVGRSGQEAIDEALYRHLDDADDDQYDGRLQPISFLILLRQAQYKYFFPLLRRGVPSG